jgi:5-methylcytosine-specific restriction protein A
MGADPFYQSTTWRTVRRRALERDGYRCQGCGVVGRGPGERGGVVLHVHHREPRSIAPMRALDVDNLVSLCAKCHDRIDKVNAKPRRAKPFKWNNLEIPRNAIAEYGDGVIVGYHWNERGHNCGHRDW